MFTKLVLVVKMATVFQEYSTEEQRSVVRFIWAKELNAEIVIKKSFLFMVGSVFHVKRLTTGWQKCRW
jgi:hypothetical protein